MKDTKSTPDSSNNFTTSSLLTSKRFRTDKKTFRFRHGPAFSLICIFPASSAMSLNWNKCNLRDLDKIKQMFSNLTSIVETPFNEFVNACNVKLMLTQYALKNKPFV